MNKKKLLKDVQNELWFLWVLAVSLALFGIIWFFNGPDVQTEMPQEKVIRGAALIALGWFILSVVILRMQGIRVTLRKPQKKVQTPAEPETGSDETEVRPAPQPVNSAILRNPETGEEQLFYRNLKTGEWVSADGKTVLPPDTL